MKSAIVFSILLALAGLAVAQDSLPPVSIQASPDGASLGIDAFAAAGAMDSPEWTGIRPGVWLKSNWKGVVGAAAVAGAAWGAYAIYDNNKSSGGHSSAAAEPAEADEADAIPTVAGDALVVGIAGDGNTVTIYNRPVAGTAE